MLKQGIIIDRHYEIIEHIGSGGMADVYKAMDYRLNRFVALKVLKEEYYDNETFLKKFLAEAEATEALSHPNIVHIYDAEYKDGYHYIVMELADGMTLKKYIRQEGRLKADKAVAIALQIAEGLRAAHDHHIIHRDIKPQNILVTEGGRVKVADFGIARVASGDTISSNTMGSVRYFSPEQARGGFADERSDIYSLGITMYEMVTGKVPFDGETSIAIAMSHLKEEVTPPREYFPDIPPSLNKIILKCTMKSPEQRYQSARALIEDLKQVFLLPDGNYVYIDSLIDDSPTVDRDQNEIQKIKEELKKYEHEHADPEEQVSEESEETADESAKKMEKLVGLLAVVAGLVVAGAIIYAIVHYGGLIHGNRGKEATTQTMEVVTTTATTESSLVTVPSFFGLNREKAAKKAVDLSLTSNFVYENGTDETMESLIVVDQDYKEGTRVEKGTTVTLTLGPDPSTSQGIEVPALVNLSGDEAEKVLKDLGLKTKKVYGNSDEVKEGYVMDQSPKGGSVVNKGFSVTITLCKGMKKVRVPSLGGLSQSAAEAELARVGLLLGDVTGDYSGEVGIGEVISQGIASGSYVDKGTKVPIVISIGEQESYRYEGTVTIKDSPFKEGESGNVELILKIGDQTDSIYQKENASVADFPLNVLFEAEKEGEGKVTMYVNGEEFGTYKVNAAAVQE